MKATTRRDGATRVGGLAGGRCGLQIAAACVGLTALAGSANADFVLNLSSTSAELDLALGQEFSVMVYLDGPSAQVHNSCIFSLLLTAPGLEIRGYDWAAPYQMASPYEYSNPGAAALPAVITPDLFVRTDAPELNDVEFSNVVDPQSGQTVATPGMILHATFAVPMSYVGPQHVFMFAIPETFANGFDVVPTQIGRGVSLNIVVPGPGGSVAGLGVCLWAMARRRRV